MNQETIYTACNKTNSYACANSCATLLFELWIGHRNGKVNAIQVQEGLDWEGTCESSWSWWTAGVICNRFDRYVASTAETSYTLYMINLSECAPCSCNLDQTTYNQNAFQNIEIKSHQHGEMLSIGFQHAIKSYLYSPQIPSLMCYSCQWAMVVAQAITFLIGNCVFTFWLLRIHKFYYTSTIACLFVPQQKENTSWN